ncbi:hypothetical protein [Rhizobium ruizarguesonis]|uniref:hypothetical protein n=1 Tax=Rhizobium ruizarguesonis TaxID=2081791 RepID=UPI00102F3342|nr:hypothetical protein [Rhizobium ruizarguesonis]
MASHSARPTLDLAAGRQVLEQQLPRVLTFTGQRIDELGWQRLSDRTLLVPMYGVHGETKERYLLRLDFLTGNDWPPSAKFVNPETLDYEMGTDQHHLPVLTSPEVHMHPAYTAGDGRVLQLICCSAVFQYYDVVHGGEESILWRDNDTFVRTISAIERAFTTHYGGRFEKHAG